MIEDVGQIHLIDPGSALKQPSLTQKVYPMNLARRAVLVEALDGGKLSAGWVVRFIVYVVEVHPHRRQVVLRRFSQDGEGVDSAPLIVHIDGNEADWRSEKVYFLERFADLPEQNCCVGWQI